MVGPVGFEPTNRETKRPQWILMAVTWLDLIMKLASNL